MFLMREGLQCRISSETLSDEAVKLDNLNLNLISISYYYNNNNLNE